MSAWEMILTDSESDMISATQAPVQTDFEEIFAKRRRIAYRYACALTRDGALAEDIVQEVFIRLYKNPDSTRNEELLSSWLPN
jgi:DNA-directed RNA polymerase specialized sigma24 family protein